MTIDNHSSVSTVRLILQFRAFEAFISLVDSSNNHFPFRKPRQRYPVGMGYPYIRLTWYYFHFLIDDAVDFFSHVWLFVLFKKNYVIIIFFVMSCFITHNTLSVIYILYICIKFLNKTNDQTCEKKSMTSSIKKWRKYLIPVVVPAARAWYPVPVIPVTRYLWYLRLDTCDTRARE